MTVVRVPQRVQAGKPVTVHVRRDDATPPLPNDVHVELHKTGGTWEPVIGYDHGIPATAGDPVHGVDLTFTPGSGSFPNHPAYYLLRVRWTHDGTTAATESFPFPLIDPIPGPPTAADQLTIEVLQPPTAGMCGAAQSQVRWHVLGGSNGWIVQHIVIASFPFQCANGLPVVPPPRGWEYWEAWRVVDGRVFIGNTGIPVTGLADLFRLPSRGIGTFGVQVIEGHVRFMPGFALNLPPWVAPGVAPAGVLPTVQAAPAGWDDAAGLEHRLVATWNCCTGASPTTVEGIPLAGIDVAEREPTDQPKRRSKVETLLDSMPAWTNLAVGDRRRRREVARIAGEIAQQRTAVIRTGIERYVERHTSPATGVDLDALSRVYVLNRYLFEVPESAESGEGLRFGGWIVPELETGADLLWPWSRSRRQLVLDGVFEGYLGHEYLALAEFDAFSERFGRRRDS
jgi:hypothetical protein